jgi:glycosyltransferase involved in cell wall biosynthesis
MTGRTIPCNDCFLTHTNNTHSFPHSVTLTIRKLEQEILAAGHDVCILTTVSGDPANTNLDGSHPNRRVIFLDNAIPIPFLNDPNHPDVSYQLGFSISPKVQQEMQDYEPSIIHITCPDCTALHLIHYARTKEIPIMGTYHSNIPEYMAHYPGLTWLKHILGHFFRHQYNFLQALYVPTPFIQKHLVDEYKLDRATTLGIWGRGVDVEHFHPDLTSLKFRHSHGIPDGVPVLLWVGRLVPEKRVDIFCDTVHRLAAAGISFHAVVVGMGPCEEKVKACPNTTFAGWMNASQLAVAYASCDVFLFPSSVETFGNVTLEAMASGLPVIVEAGCSGHLVRNGENGFAVTAGDAHGFYQATALLMKDGNLRKDFSKKSREMSLLLEKTAVVRKMLDYYSAVTDEFFMEYGGHHANRDVVYHKPHSFVGGNHPRPILFVVVEKLFILLFQVIWNMTSMFVYMQETLVRGRPAAAQFTAVETSESGVAVPGSPKKAVPPGSNSSNMVLDVSAGDSQNIVDLTNVNIDEDPLAEADDDTDSTADSSEVSDVQSAPCALSCFPGSDQAFGDCALSHTLAKTFVRFMMFQMRMESLLRNCGSSCCASSVLRGGAKRKNSSFYMQEMRPEIVGRNRSEATCGDEDAPVQLLMPEDAGHHRMRSRAQMSVTLDIV